VIPWNTKFDKAEVFTQGVQSMGPMEFQVCRQRRKSRWVVMVGNSLSNGNSLYRAYLDKEQALLDAVDAARDALQAGCEARIWIRDRSTMARVF
jgi:hypothetical protein